MLTKKLFYLNSNFVYYMNIFRKMNNATQGAGLYLIGVLFHTILIVVFKKVMKIYSDVSVYQIIFIRQMIIVFFLLPYMMKERFDFFNKERFKPNLVRNVLFAISSALLYKGLAIIPVNDAVTIQFIIPIIASIMAVVLLKEKPSEKLWFGLLLCIAGVAYAKKPSLNAEEISGYVFLLACVFLRGYITILNKKLTKHSSVMQMLCYTHVIMLFFNFGFFTTFKAVSVGLVLWSAFLAIAFFAEYFFMYYGYRKCDVSALQPLDFFKLIFSMLISYLVLQEKVTIDQAIGGIVVVFAYLYSSGKVKIFNKKAVK